MATLNKNYFKPKGQLGVEIINECLCGKQIQFCI